MKVVDGGVLVFCFVLLFFLGRRKMWVTIDGDGKDEGNGEC